VPSSPATCGICGARNLNQLCGLAEPVRTRISQDHVTHLFHRGQPVFFAGMPAQAIYVIRSGRVKVFRTLSGGTEQVLRLLGPGEMLGYRPLLAGEPYMASAEAVVESTLCVIPADTVRELLATVPEFSAAMLVRLARELSRSEDLMMDNLHRPVRQRVAGLLLQLLTDNQGAPEPLVLRSEHLRRLDMARMVGTTPETFSRVLRAFALRGILALTRERIRVRDRSALQKVAGSSGIQPRT
jgi:CRP/FNR family transcriptional regulator, polysaccharide utilization system transcription regulator